MKLLKRFTALAIMAAACCASALWLPSCNHSGDDDIIWDYVPVTVAFEIVDRNGDDLIAKEADLYRKDFAVMYRDRKFDAQWGGPDGSFGDTRMIAPVLYGLCYMPEASGRKALLIFGQLDGNPGEVTLTLRMPDETEHDVYINRQILTQGKEPVVRQTVRLDGQTIGPLTDGGPNMLLTVTVE